MHHVEEEDNEIIKGEKLRAALEKRKQERRVKLAKAKQMKKEQEEKERAEEDDVDEVPEYMKSPKGEDLIYREKLTEELELERMPGTPFDRHELSLGSKVAGEFFDADFRIVGFFKGMIRVLTSPDEKAPFDVKKVLHPAPVVVRAYVLSAYNLAAKDVNLDNRLFEKAVIDWSNQEKGVKPQVNVLTL